MSNQINVFLDLHHYQGFGAYWNNLALEIPNGWITHYKHLLGDETVILPDTSVFHSYVTIFVK